MLRILGIPVSKWSMIMVAGDVLALGLSFTALSAMFFAFGSLPPGVFWLRNRGSVAILTLAILLIFYIMDLYDQYQDYRSGESISRLLFGTWLAILLTIFLGHKQVLIRLDRQVLEWLGFTFGIILIGWRSWLSVLTRSRYLRRRALIIGAGEAGRSLLELIQKRPQGGFDVLGFIDDDPQKIGTFINGTPVLGGSEKLSELIKEHRADSVILAITRRLSPFLLNRLSKLTFNSVKVFDLPTIYETLAGKIPVNFVSENWLFLHSILSSQKKYRHCKRLLDLVIALTILALSWPLMILIAIIIRMESPGPALFRQKRLGQEGREFTIYKFRTMVANAEAEGPRFATLQGKYITRIGYWLRKTRLDELPQLFNILKGDMSIIGPRPERRFFVEQFQELQPILGPGRRQGDKPGALVTIGYQEKIPFYSYRLVVKPGVTGWAQVMYGYASNLEENQEKLCYDLFYIKNMNFFLDLIIILKTIRIVFLGRGK